jgi:hypothetical protein
MSGRSSALAAAEKPVAHISTAAIRIIVSDSLGNGIANYGSNLETEAAMPNSYDRTAFMRW